MSMAYIRRYYGVPAKRGGRVEWRQFCGTIRPGTITRATAYVYIRFDDDPRWSIPLHPREAGLVYMDDIAPDGAGEVPIAESPSWAAWNAAFPHIDVAHAPGEE